MKKLSEMSVGTTEVLAAKKKRKRKGPTGPAFSVSEDLWILIKAL